MATASNPAIAPRIIDTHVHAFGNAEGAKRIKGKIKSKRDAITMRFTDPELHRFLWGTAEDRTDVLIADMDASNINAALIQVTGGAVSEDVATAVKRHPGRLYPLYSTGKRQLDGAVSRKIDLGEIRERAQHFLRDQNFVGIGEIIVRDFTEETAPKQIANALTPFFEIIAPYKKPVQIPTAWTNFPTPLEHGIPMFVDHLAERFPELPIIITKMGRSYDFLFEIALAVAYKHWNVYVDTAQSRPEHIVRAVRDLGPNRVMFGTDWCDVWRELNEPNGIYPNGLRLIEDANLSPSDREWVLGQTAVTLYGI